VVRWAEPVLRVSLWFLAIFLCFDVLAPTRETFFAAIGSAAIAIGLGAQDLIKNLVGGLVVLADRPYQLGDRVKIGDAYGEIDHIGLRSTKLTTPDDTRVTIPNADVLTEKVYNANSGVPDCQVVTDLFVPIETDVDEAVRIGYEAAYTSPYTWLDKPVAVLVSHAFDQQPYIRVRVKAYVFDHRFEPRMQHDITCRAQRAFQRIALLQPWD
jgi:small-conductance mechanosensitive channel